MKFDKFKVNKGNFRSYDVRGEYPNEIDASTAYAIAQAFIEFNPAKRVVVGYDHRQSSPALRDSLIQGLLDAGVNVWDIGQVTTDTTYFASWNYQPEVEGAVMITASHMPSQFNGFKFITKELKPIGKGSGMEELYEFASGVKVQGSGSKDQGSVEHKDVLSDYLKFLWGFIDKDKIKSMKVVMDCGNGVAGPTVRKVFESLPLEIVELFFELDATFPNHEPSPIEAKNRLDLVAKVKEVGADLGIAWDADADRCFIIDEKGQFVNGCLLTAFLSIQFLKKNPGAHVVYDIVSSNVVPDTIKKYGGVPHVQRVGHSHIKKMMREVGAVFGGENSGHYYFADNKFMDNGFIPALLILELLSESGKKMSELIADLGQYYIIEETNSDVDDKEGKIAELKEHYKDGAQDFLDGITVEYPDWRFNVRPSNTDMVLRLNLEANSQKMMEEKREEVLKIIRKN